MQPRVLVVDDSVLMRHLVKETLISDGWEVAAEAANGKEAIEMYKKHRPDVVSLDIIMPESDGLEALRGIRQFDPNARVVVVSAINQTKNISDAIRAGAQDFITKPFMPDELQSTMRACVDDMVQVRHTVAG